MDISRISKFIKDSGEKFILMENGEPEVVVMSFKEYENLARKTVFPKNTSYFNAETPQEEPFFYEGERQHVKKVDERKDSSLRMENIRIEDLPI